MSFGQFAKNNDDDNGDDDDVVDNRMSQSVAPPI